MNRVTTSFFLVPHTGSVDETCTICWSDFSDIKQPVVAEYSENPKIRHVFHQTCLEQWRDSRLFQVNSATCPLCQNGREIVHIGGIIDPEELVRKERIKIAKHVIGCVGMGFFLYKLIKPPKTGPSDMESFKFVALWTISMGYFGFLLKEGLKEGLIDRELLEEAIRQI